MKKLSMDELGRKSLEEYKMMTKNPVIVILDDIRSMNNVGSIFRTSDAFAVEKIYLCGITAAPPHKEINKTALGATESVDWEYQEDVVAVVKKLQTEGVRVFMIEQTDASISLEKLKISENERVAVVLGNEVFGVSDKLLTLCDGCLEIPQFGTKHSLNVTNAAAIVLWEITKQRL